MAMLHRIIPRTRVTSALSIREVCDVNSEQECPELHHAKTRLQELERKAEERGRPERRAEPRVPAPFQERHQFS